MDETQIEERLAWGVDGNPHATISMHSFWT